MALRPRTFPFTAAIITVAALTLAGCGGSSGPAAPKGAPPQAPPAGYQWVGLRADHIWLTVPDSWVTLNLNDMSVTQAMERVHLSGQTAAELRTGIEQLKAAGGIIVVDTRSVATSPVKFATNVNTFCTPSSLVPGPSAANAIISQTESEYPHTGVRIISDRKVISTARLVLVSIDATLQNKAGTVYQLQFITLTTRGLICYTSFSTDRPEDFYPQFDAIAHSIELG